MNLLIADGLHTKRIAKTASYTNLYAVIACTCYNYQIVEPTEFVGIGRFLILTPKIVTISSKR